MDRGCGWTPDRITFAPEISDCLMDSSQACRPLASSSGTSRMRRMMTLGDCPTRRRVLSSSPATPKKNGPVMWNTYAIGQRIALIEIPGIEVDVLPPASIDFDRLRHARHVQKGGNGNTDTDCHRQVHQHRQPERQQQEGAVAVDR